MHGSQPQNRKPLVTLHALRIHWMLTLLIAPTLRRPFLLRNQIECQTCGHALHGRVKKSGGRVYTCPNGSDPNSPHTQPHTTTINAAEVEAQVWAAVRKFLADPWQIAAVWHAFQDDSPNESPSTIDIPLDEFTARVRHAISARDYQTQRDLIHFLVSRIIVSDDALQIEYRAKFRNYSHISRIADDWLALANLKARELLWMAREFKHTWWVDGRLEQVPRLFTQWFLPLYLMWMAFTSVLFAVNLIQIGLMLDGFLIILLLYFVGYLPPSPEARLAWASALPPILRLLSYSVPIPNASLMVQLAVVGVPALLATLIMMHALRQPLSVYGISLRNLPIQLAIAPIGIVVGLLQWKLFGPQLSVLYADMIGADMIGTDLTCAGLTCVERTAFLSLFITGVTEELVFRGVLQQSVAAVYRDGQYRGSGLIGANVAFAIMHMGYGPIAIIFSFCVGMVYSRLTYVTGNVFGVLIAHGLSSIVLLWLMAL